MKKPQQTLVNLRSDNESAAHPAMLAAIAQANEGSAHAYGEDALSESLDRHFSAFFETAVSVFPLISGTAANAISLAACSPPFGAVFCHPDAHINADECGAPEFYGGGIKLIPVAGENGKYSADSLTQTLAGFGFHGDHEPLPSVVSIAQATERGTVYSLDELAAISTLAKANQMHLHMDGARFANALVSLGCSAAEMTWKAGVDILSFGATKNGALGAEAIIVFNPELVPQIARRRMQGGHLLSKMRYVSAQLLAYLENHLLVELATNSNRAAARMARALVAHPEATLDSPVMANEIFVRLSDKLAGRLSEAFEFHPWPGDPGLYRLLAAWNIAEDDLRHFEALVVDKHADLT